MQQHSFIDALNQEPFPLLGGLREGPGFRLLLTAENADLYGRDLSDQRAFQAYLDATYGKAYTWGTSGYLEYRDVLLKHLPQMRREKRYYHLGLDVLAPVASPLFAPLDGVVIESGFEAGTGNYGGFVLLRHHGPDGDCYSLYGHLDRNTLPPKHQRILRGESFARIGDLECNGEWFHHVHMQLLTAKALEEGFLFRGYCREDELDGISERCPSPLAMFR